MKYILALLVLALGFFLVAKTEWFVQNFGTSEWAESKLGTSGGTRIMYKFIGLLFIFLALMGATGQLGGFILAIFGGLFGAR